MAHKNLALIASFILISFWSPFLVADELKVGVLGSKIRPDPIALQSMLDSMLVEQVFQPLVAIDAQGEIRSMLAKSWKVTDSGRRYIFEISPTASFSDGSRVLPDDVVRSLRSHLEPSSKSMFRDHLRTHVTSPEAITSSKGLVEIRTLQRSHSFLRLLSAPGLAIFKRTPSGQLIGSGPYVVEKQGKDSIRLKRRVHEHALQPALVSVFVHKDFKRHIRSIESGEVEYVLGFPEAADFELARRVKVTMVENNIKYYLVLNDKDPKMSDKDFRTEFSRQLQEIAKNCHDPRGILRFDHHMLPKGFMPINFYQSYENPRITISQFFKKWKQLLKPNSIKVILTGTAGSHFAICLKRFSSSIENALDIQVMSYEEYDHTREKGDFQVRRFFYRPDYMDADGFLGGFRRWLDFERFAKRISEVAPATPVERSQHYLKVLQEFADHATLVPLYSMRVPIFHKRPLKIHDGKHQASPSLFSF